MINNWLFKFKKINLIYIEIKRVIYFYSIYILNNITQK